MSGREFRVTRSTHSLDVCQPCNAARESAIGTARVTGSVGATHTVEHPDHPTHSVTVTRLSPAEEGCTVNIWTTPAQPVNGKHGTTDTALLVEFPSGEIIPVGVQTGRTAAEFTPIYGDLGGYTVVGVRQGGVTRREAPPV